MKTKSIVILVLVFLLINSIGYILTQSNGKQRIKLALNDSLRTLKTHYNILLQTQETIANSIYELAINNDKFIDIMRQANISTDKERVVLRGELEKFFIDEYKISKQKGVFQYHFVLANNMSFLRMHDTDKFGDDLTNLRDDFKYVHINKKKIRGFTKGKSSHGFRNTFPLFDKNNEYIGAMDISFSSDSFQWYLNYVSNIHTHFLIDQSIFNSSVDLFLA